MTIRGIKDEKETKSIMLYESSFIMRTMISVSNPSLVANLDKSLTLNVVHEAA